MADPDDSRRSPSRRPILPALLVAAGVLIGLALSSHFDWLPAGRAVPEPAPMPAQGRLHPSADLQLEPETGAPAPPPVPRQHSFVQVAKAVTPAVVNIFTSRRGEGGPGGHPQGDPLFRRFFGEELFRRYEPPSERKERSLGSGVIVASHGFIVTNNHVVNEAHEIKIYLADKRAFKAKLVGVDAKTDLALLKVDASGLQTVPWADSDRLEVGEFVLAVGNPFGLNQTVTLGIVSAVGRASMGIAEYEDFIQTDAAINPGNSGGALVNAQGELVGINTAIFSESGGNMGIGFAVPSNMARLIVEQLERSGTVVRGWLGISIQEMTPELASQFGVSESHGVLVSEVLPGSPAQQAGFERGDVIVAFGDRTVETPAQLRNAVAATPVGVRVSVTVVRRQATRPIDVVIAEQPKTVAQAPIDVPPPVVATGLLSGLEVREPPRDPAARMGVRERESGVLVARVEPGSAADEAGLVEGDVILELNRQPVRDRASYERLRSVASGAGEVLLLIKRQGRTSYVILKS